MLTIMNIELLNLINYNVCWFFNYVGEKNWGIWCFFFLAESLESEKNYSDHSFRWVTCFLVFWPWFLCFFIFFQHRVLLDSTLLPCWCRLILGCFLVPLYLFISFSFFFLFLRKREGSHFTSSSIYKYYFYFLPLLSS
jgi:hypothetical protein